MTMASRYSPGAREFVARHISKHIRKYGMSPRQAVAVALSEARKKGLKVPGRRK